MPDTKTKVQPATKKTIKDAQTGKTFDVVEEGRIDVIFAWISAAYSIAVIFYLTWLVLQMLYAKPPASLPASLLPILSWPPSKLIFYSAIGGAIGASVNNLRSFIAWHAEDKAFGWRFIWKYLAMPPLGGTLAVIVYGILQGGLAVFTGGTTPGGTANEVTSLSAWVTGTLAGYGAHKVFKWLDDKVNSLFKVDSAQTTVPDVKGQSPDEAKKMLTDAQLEVGTVSEAAAPSPDLIGKVIAQTPAAGTQSECGRKVDLTFGIAGPDADPDPTVAPDLSAKSPGSNGTSKVDETAETVGAVTGSASTGTVGTDSSSVTVASDTGAKTNEAEATAGGTPKVEG